MNCVRPTVLLNVLVLVGAQRAMSQKPVPPPPKPADSGPSLAETMKFIQEKMNGQGRVGYTTRYSNLAGVTYRVYYTISDVKADPVSCTLVTKETTITLIDPDAGITYSEGGKPVTGDDLRRTLVADGTTSLKKVVSISVESAEDVANRNNARAAHPENTVQYTPPVFQLTLHADSGIEFRHEFKRGNGSPVSTGPDTGVKENTYYFQDQELADRVAKALTHAVELCGGGSKDPF